MDRPGHRRHGHPDHPSGPALPGLHADRLDPGDRGADRLPARPDPPVRARRRVPGRRGRPTQAAARHPARAGCSAASRSSSWPRAAIRRCSPCSPSRSSPPGCRRSTSPPAASSVPRLVPPERLPVGHRPQPAQLPGRLDRRAGPGRGPHRDGRSGRRLPRRRPVVRRRVVGRAGHPPLPPLGREPPGLAAIREGLPSCAAAGRSSARSSSTSSRWSSPCRPPCSRCSPSTSSRSGRSGSACSPRRRRPGRSSARLFSGWVGRVVRVGRAVVAASSSGGWRSPRSGSATVARSSPRAVPRHLGIALLMLAIAGAADMCSAVLRSTIVQLEAPDSCVAGSSDPHPRRHRAGRGSATSNRRSWRRSSVPGRRSSLGGLPVLAASAVHRAAHARNWPRTSSIAAALATRRRRCPTRLLP